jgi:hypothetical protein
MRHPFLPALLLVLSTSACAAPSANRAVTSPTLIGPPTTDPGNPTSLEEALTRAGLVRFEPTLISREMTHDMGNSTRVEGRRVTMSVSAGWSAQTPIFARRNDGSVVLVDAQPQTIVDQHVNGGCRHFFGGRMWFETHIYELPEGSSFEGSLRVRWDDHIEAVDYSPTEADGSPCPPPALD